MASVNGNNAANNLDGTAANDQIFGFDNSNDRLGLMYNGIAGEAGSDTMLGGAGNDLCGGGSGNAVLCGGPGNDRMFGDGAEIRSTGGGNDSIAGGDGFDVAHFDLPQRACTAQSASFEAVPTPRRKPWRTRSTSTR